MLTLLPAVVGFTAHVAAALGSNARGSEGRPNSAFAFKAVRLPPSIRQAMIGRSWRPGCPVGFSGLRYLTVAHWDFNGHRRLGRMIASRDSVSGLRKAFAFLYERRFPIRRMVLVDSFGGSDYQSIRADNSSAFNCRLRTGGGGWSEHSYGRAVDINPIENPYVAPDGTTLHRESQPFLRRHPYRPGMAVRRGVLVQAFAGSRWRWGGSWSGVHDYQHFSATGR